MLQMLGSPRRFCDGITRRQTLTAGALSVFGGAFHLPPLLALEAARPASVPGGRAKNVIMLYLHGGAATQDMFDLKPAAPAQIRGEFSPIATNVPGIEICEHLPLMARWMHRCAIVRTVNHNAGCHNTLPSFSGDEQPVDINNPVPRDVFAPGMGAVVEWLKPAGVDTPHYAALPTYLGWGYSLRRPGPYGGFLGSRFDPLCGECSPKSDPSPPAGRKPMWIGTPALAGATLAPDMTIDRLHARRTLLEQIDDAQRAVESRALPASATGAAQSYGRFRERAFGLLTASKLKAAFDLEREAPKVRDRYGRHLFGQSALVARRLVEAGVRFVDVYWDGYSYKVPTPFDPYWDTHSANFITLRQCNLPNLDQTFDALMSDLDQRGLLDETLVMINTDFGRTPNVNGNAGRDHWTPCYANVLAGGGIRGGTVIGQSDERAAYVKDRPVRPRDICATVYQALGIDPHTLIADRTGRPLPIAHGGEPIAEALA